MAESILQMVTASQTLQRVALNVDSILIGVNSFFAISATGCYVSSVDTLMKQAVRALISSVVAFVKSVESFFVEELIALILQDITFAQDAFW